MARYIDADALIKMIDRDIICLTKDCEDTKSLIMEQIGKKWFAPTCDVVPRSEVEELELKLEAERSFKPLAITLAKQEVAREIFDVLDKKKRYLMKNNNYNLFKASIDFFDHIDDFVGLTGEEILAEIEKKYIGE